MSDACACKAQNERSVVVRLFWSRGASSLRLTLPPLLPSPCCSSDPFAKKDWCVPPAALPAASSSALCIISRRKRGGARRRAAWRRGQPVSQLAADAAAEAVAQLAIQPLGAMTRPLSRNRGRGASEAARVPLDFSARMRVRAPLIPVLCLLPARRCVPPAGMTSRPPACSTPATWARRW